jgi:hypothetical protein
MKTAMQELIYDLKLLQEKDDVKLIDIEELIEYATHLLEKEKEQIMAAKNDPTLKIPLEYYNQTYNQNK